MGNLIIKCLECNSDSDPAVDKKTRSVIEAAFAAREKEKKKFAIETPSKDGVYLR